LTRGVCAAAAAAVLVACASCGGGSGGGGQIQRVEALQQCLKGKQLPTNLSRGVDLVGAKERADVVDTELLSPSAARLYVFKSVRAAEAAVAGSAVKRERRDNVVIVYAHPPTKEDRAVLEECFSGKF
jgi:hypothetical protein